MKIILLSDIENLGESGDVIAVKPGYARNKLIPQGLALRASNRNIAVANENKRVATSKLERENQALNVLAKNLQIKVPSAVKKDAHMFVKYTQLELLSNT